MADTMTESIDNAERPARSGGHWGKLLLSVPIVAAIITAGPSWVDMAQTAWVNYQSPPEYRKISSVSDARNQNQLWQKNLECTQIEPSWKPYADGGYVDAVICDSGDLFVQIRDSYNRMHQRWVAKDSLVKLEAGTDLSLVAPAKAAGLYHSGVQWRLQSESDARLTLAQGPQLLCQKMRPDGRGLYRVVMQGNSCVGQVVDTYTGAIISSMPVDCRAGCG